jgi:transcriptional regulator with XRE-family HTH domain
MGAPLGDLIANNVRGERSRRRLRQADVAARLGWAVSSYSDLENGKRRLALEDVPAVCRALGVTMADLVRGADPEDLRALGLSL